MRTLLILTLVAAAPAHAGGRVALVENLGKTTAVSPVPNFLMNFAAGAGVASGLVIPRLQQSGMPGYILQMPAPNQIGGPLNALPETPAFISATYELTHNEAIPFAPTPAKANPADEIKAAKKDKEALEKAIPSTLDPKEARKKSETLGNAAEEMRRDDGPSFGKVFDNGQRATAAAADAIEAQDFPVRLPSARNYDGMITALTQNMTFRQDGLAQLQAMVKKALERNDLQFLARFALLSMHDPRAHALAIGGIRKMAEKDTDLGSAARNSLEGIAHYRSDPSQIPGRDTTIPRDLRAAAPLYSR